MFRTSKCYPVLYIANDTKAYKSAPGLQEYTVGWEETGQLLPKTGVPMWKQGKNKGQKKVLFFEFRPCSITRAESGMGNCGPLIRF